MVPNYLKSYLVSIARRRQTADAGLRVDDDYILDPELEVRQTAAAGLKLIRIQLTTPSARANSKAGFTPGERPPCSKEQTADAGYYR